MVLAVALGGALGSVGRYLLTSGIGAWLGAGFPYGTLAVNVIGSFVMGMVVELSALVWSPGPALRALLAVGVLGGFTTFSTFSLDVANLAERGDLAAAAVYMGASVSLSVAALFAGLHLIRAVLA